MTKVSTIVTDVQKVEKSVKGRPDPIVYEEFAINDFHWQGDICVQRVKSHKTTGKKGAHGLQLAPGTTQGSRHIIHEKDERHVKIFESKNTQRGEIYGPTVVATKDWTLTHPQHGHVTFPKGTYNVTYQRLLANELRRRQD